MNPRVAGRQRATLTRAPLPAACAQTVTVRAALPKPVEAARLAMVGATAGLMLSAAQPAFAGNLCVGNPTGACAARVRRALRRASWQRGGRWRGNAVSSETPYLQHTC